MQHKETGASSPNGPFQKFLDIFSNNCIYPYLHAARPKAATPAHPPGSQDPQAFNEACEAHFSVK